MSEAELVSEKEYETESESELKKETQRHLEENKFKSIRRYNEKYQDLLDASTYLENLKPGNLPSENDFIRIVSLTESFLIRDTRQDASWERICMAYDVFLKLISLDSVEILLRASVSEQYISWLFQNFNSPDQREKDKIKVLLHRLYCKMAMKRPLMRRKISDLLLQHIYDEKVKGIVELLELYSCIISGLGVPIREEHLVVLEKVLFPLHNVDELNKITKFLTYCIAQFLYKDGTLAKMIFTGILRHWPKANSEHEILFLQEVEDLLEVIEPFQFKNVHEDLLKQLSKCIISPIIQVCERSLKLFANDRVLSLCLQNPRTVPLLLPALLSTSKTVSPARVLHLLACLEAADSRLFNILVNASRQKLQ